MKTLTLFLAVLFLLATLNAGTRTAQSESKAEMNRIPLEGVATGAQSAPLTALREAGERIKGRAFVVTNGKLVNLSLATPGPFDSERMELLRVEKLSTEL